MLQRFISWLHASQVERTDSHPILRELVRTPLEFITLLEKYGDEPAFYPLYRQQLERTDFNTFDRLPHDKHGNTLLLLALAWNALTAATILLALDTDNIALYQRDTFLTAQNTPLLLAAKINATSLMALLLSKGAKPDEQDYRGFTALHYACIYRNDKAIALLLAYRADTGLKDAFGEYPKVYYDREIDIKELDYPYGLRRDIRADYLLETYDNHVTAR